jgi:hypothetical protein
MQQSQLEGTLAGLAASIRQGKFPWWYPGRARDKAIDTFAYGTDFTPLNASATVQNSINISGDSAFVILAAVLVETDTANTTFLANRPLLFRIQDTGSGRYLSNIAVHADNWFGTAELPKYWDIPKIIAPNSTLVVEAQNLEAVNRNVRVTFHGFKIFAFSPGE